jgi:hypothetical protein
LQPTEAGGLWFLLPVLARLGIGAWMQEHPDAADDDLPWRVLTELARRVETSAHDPVWSVLQQGASLRHGDVRGIRPEVVDQPVVWWCDRVQEWCAALPGLSGQSLPLATIVRRRGWLYTTATHIDVFFDLAQADLRIRRLGLDLDPGWLPWLRRVVTFYYEAGLIEVSG